MKRKTVCAIIFLLSLSIHSEAQMNSSLHFKDTVPLTQLVRNFHKYHLKDAAYDMMKYDNVEQNHTSVTEYFESSPLKNLKHASADGCCAQWRFTLENNQQSLYLISVLPLNKSKKEEAIKLYFYLKQKYGKVPDKGIPAKWVDGQYFIMCCPKNMFGEVVSKSEAVVNIKKGVIVSRTYPMNSGSMETPRMENGRVLISTGGCWNEKVPLHTRYLSRFVNENRKVRSDSDKEKYFSILLFTNLQGKSKVIFLDRKAVVVANKIILDDLANCIDKLPVNSFIPMKTLSGKLFQGRYMKATYIGNLGWFFTDYASQLS